MRLYITAALAALIVTSAATAAPAPKHHPRQAAPTIVQLFWNGNPPNTLSYTRELGTVPPGKTWTITYMLMLTEKLHPYSTPTGGDGTITLMVNSIPLAETSFGTGSRINYQEGPAHVTLPAGTDLTVFTFTNPIDPPEAYFLGISVMIEQRPS